MKLEVFTGLAFAAVLAGVLATDQSLPSVETRLASAGGTARPLTGQDTAPPRDDRACGPSGDIFGELDARYRERPVAAWHHSVNGMLTFLGSDDGTSWSLVMSMPDGFACLVASGEVWHRFDRPVAEGPGA